MLIGNWVIQISTIRTGGQSLKGYVVEKILHLFHPLFKTKCQFTIPRKKRAFLTSVLCCRLNFQSVSMPFLLLSSAMKQCDFYPVLVLQKSRWWRALLSLRHVTMIGLIILRLLSYVVRVFRFILLISLTCLSHFANNRANGSLKMLFLYLRMPSTKRELPSCFSAVKFFQDLRKSCVLSFVLLFNGNWLSL